MVASLIALLARGAALELRPSEEADGKNEMLNADRYGQVRVKPVRTFVAAGALAAAATAMQVVTPAWVERVVLGGPSFEPGWSLGGYRGPSWLVQVAMRLHLVKLTRPLLMTLMHSLVRSVATSTQRAQPPHSHPCRAHTGVRDRSCSRRSPKS